MAGINYFGLLRRVYSTEVLARVVGLTVADVKATKTSGRLHDNNRLQNIYSGKYKKLWKAYLKKKKDVSWLR